MVWGCTYEYKCEVSIVGLLIIWLLYNMMVFKKKKNMLKQVLHLYRYYLDSIRIVFGHHSGCRSRGVSRMKCGFFLKLDLP